MENTIRNGKSIRTLGTSERLYWLYDKISCTNFVIDFKLSCSVKESAVLRAVDKASAKFEILRSYISVNNGKASIKINEKPICPVRIAVEGEEIKAGSELDRPLDKDAGPMAVTLLNRSVETSEVFFTFRHALLDGRSGVSIALEILDLAINHQNAKEDITVPVGPNQEKLFPPKWRNRLRSLPGFTVLLLYEFFSKIVNGKIRPIPELASTKQTPRNRSQTIELMFDADQTAILLEKCRAHNGSVTSTIAAVQMLAVKDLMPENCTGIGVNIATDLSPMLVEAREFLSPGMYIGLCAVCDRNPDKKDIAQLSAKLKKRLQSRLALGAAHLFWTHFPPQFFFSPDLKGAQRLDHFMRIAPPISVVSNLGAVSAGQNGVNSRKNSMAHVIRQIGFYMAPQTGCPFVTAVVSWEGRLSINLTYNPDALIHSTAEKIADNIYKQLVSYSGNLSGSSPEGEAGS